MELTDFLTILAEGLLIIALPIAIAAAFQYARLLGARVRGQLDENQRVTVDRAVTIAVQAAEQVGIWQKLIGPDKREHAIQVAQRFLDERGIKIDIERLVDLIEAEVLRQFSNPTPPVDSAEGRQALIDSAIEAAVLAAEQSGLKGLIGNIGTEKKAYAIRMAAEYLNEHGIAVDEELIGGLIEAQLLRLTLAARSGGSG